MTSPVAFYMKIDTTHQEPLFFKEMPPLPVPRIGEQILIPSIRGVYMGWWRVESVLWQLPHEEMNKPNMTVHIIVSWGDNGGREQPIYDEFQGWVRTV